MRFAYAAFVAGFVLTLSGCAEVVHKDYTGSRSGTVRYSTGWFLADKNRAKAVEQMNEYCGSSKPKLLSEDSKSEYSGQSYSNTSVSRHNVDTTTTQGKNGYVYLHFQCVGRKPVSKS